MEAKEKIIQISASGKVLYALGSEGNLYVGTQHEKGFEWRKLPELNVENMGSVPRLGAAEDEGSQRILSAPAGEDIQTPAVKRDDVVVEAPKKEEPKNTATTPTTPQAK